MTWRVTSTTDGKHLGARFGAVLEGDRIIFPDGGKFTVQKVEVSADGQRMVASSPNYIAHLRRE